MSDMGMDPEIMAAFLGARDNNSNVSGLLGNLDNPMLAYLAGVYDPMAGQAGGGQLWASYANNPDYPIVQDIMQKIQNGADPFYLNSYIDSIAGDADFNGFQDADLKGLAKSLYNEYTGGGSGGGDGAGGGGGGGTWWGKAGLRNPTDVYTMADVPLSSDSRKMLSEARKKDIAAKSKLSDADAAVKAARSKLSNLYDKDFSTTELMTWLRNDPEGKKIAKEKNIDWDKVDETTGQVFGWGASKDTSTGWWDPISVATDLVSIPLREASRATEVFVKENVGGGKGKYIEDVVGYGKPEDPYAEYAYEKAKFERDALASASDRTSKLEEAARRGALRAMQDQGRTPTRDQLNTMMKFVQNT
jgi:hypothetical protein